MAIRNKNTIKYKIPDSNWKYNPKSIFSLKLRTELAN